MKTICQSLVFTFAFQFVALICHGQYYFRHYQVDNGLVYNAVSCIMQDSRGFMWIGTRGGLNRFDGTNFKTFLNKNNQFESISDNIITALAEDKNGMIWIGTAKGIFELDPYKGRLTDVQIKPRGYVNNLVIDNYNNLWFVSNHSLYKYNQQKNQVEKTNIQASYISKGYHKNLWIGKDNGTVGLYNTQEKKLKSVRIVSNEAPLDQRSISKIYPINDSLVLIGCFSRGLKLYNGNSGIISSLPLESPENNSIYIRDITAGDSNKFWVATESGIYIYDLSTNKSIHLKKRAGDPYSITDNAVYALCQDRQEGMWVGTYFGGLQYYSKKNARFKKYYPIPNANSISGDAIGQITPDKEGNLWIGTEDAGINKFNPKTNKFTHYAATKKKGELSYPNIHGLLAFKNKLYIGPLYHGMEIMDMTTGHIIKKTKVIGEKSEKASNFINRFYLTKDSTILVGTSFANSGLYLYNDTFSTFKRIKQIPFNSYVLAIVEDHTGNIWTGSVSRGAFYYNPRTGAHGNIHFGETVNNKRVNEYTVLDILEASDQSLWFATVGGGLIRLSKDRKKMKRFTTKNGLLSNVVYCILEDNNKHLWVSTLKGLISFDLRTEKATAYTKSNGLTTNQFNHSSAYKGIDGHMYFGTVKGMIEFDPRSFEAKEAAPATYITGFQINNKEIQPGGKNSPLVKSILYTDTIELTHKQNNFSIEFVALDYASPEAVKYKYRMKGLAGPWTYLNSNRQAYFTDLAPGNYEFILQAESSTGSWHGEQKKLFIKIIPPFWKTNLAYLFYFFLIAGGTYWLIRMKLKRVNKQNQRKLQLFKHEQEKEIYQAKIEFFTHIAHEIRTPLTLIAGPIEWLKGQFDNRENVKKSLSIAARNANRLIELTSQLLDFRKTETEQFSLNYVNTDIFALLSEQVARFKQEALNNNIRLELIDPESSQMAFVDREAFIKICSNLISNAIKYASSAATIQINGASPNDDHFSIQFSNDGNGIGEEFQKKIFEPFFRIKGSNKPGTGIGLSLAHSLTELHNGSLRLVSGKPGKVIFELKLPIHQKFEFQLSNWKKIN